jgi:hypothetical protein
MKTATTTRMSTAISTTMLARTLTSAYRAGVAPSFRGSVSKPPVNLTGVLGRERGPSLPRLSAEQDRQPWQYCQGEPTLMPHSTAVA